MRALLILLALASTAQAQPYARYRVRYGNYQVFQDTEGTTGYSKHYRGGRYTYRQNPYQGWQSESYQSRDFSVYQIVPIWGW